MINFRFHLVSLVAVFLALAAGIVIGSTVIDAAVVDGLRDRINTVEDRADQTDNENRDLRSKLGALTAEAEATGPYAVNGALQGVPVAVVAARGIDEGRVDALVRRVQDADGSIPAVIWLEPSWALSDADARARLEAVVGRTTTNDAALRARWLGLLAERLASPRRSSNGSVTDPADDALKLLADAGFVTVDTLSDVDPAAVDAWPGTGGRAFVVGGNNEQGSASNFTTAITRAMNRAEIPTVAADVYSADELQPRGARLEALRSADDLSKLVSTVDNLDENGGVVASVLALHDIANDIVGHYGYGEGAQRPFPVWNAP